MDDGLFLGRRIRVIAGVKFLPVSFYEPPPDGVPSGLMISTIEPSLKLPSCLDANGQETVTV